MLNKTIEKALNEQIQKEIYSAYLYLAMSADCTDKGYEGFAKWFMIQYHEEMFHAMKIYNYIFDQDGKAVLMQIDQPKVNAAGPEDLFKTTLEHEKTVTASIHHLVDLARQEHDHATEIFLQWYVTEQVEEEKNATDILTKFKVLGGQQTGPGVYMLDQELGSRVLGVQVDFTQPLAAE